MPFARGNMRDHIVEHKNDHEASHGRYVVCALGLLSLTPNGLENFVCGI